MEWHDMTWVRITEKRKRPRPWPNLASQFKIDGKIHKSLGSKLSIQNDLNKFKINKGKKVDWVPLSLPFNSAAGFIHLFGLLGFSLIANCVGSFASLVYWVLSQLFPELQQQFCPCFLTV
jgi:hypothetical protein